MHKLKSFLLILLSTPLAAANYDLTCDGEVNFDDFFMFIEDYGKNIDPSLECGVVASDFDCNYTVNFDDFFLFADNFGENVNISADCYNDIDVSDDSERSLFYGPASFGQILASERSIVWQDVEGNLTNLQTFAMVLANTSDLITIVEDFPPYAGELRVKSGMKEEAVYTVDALLLTTFKLIEIGIETYQLVSLKHSNYAIDVATIDGTEKLILRDFRSYYLDKSNAGYLTFSINEETGGYSLTAQDRFVYSNSMSDFVLDSSWGSTKVQQLENSLVLNSNSVDSHALFTLLEAPIPTQIPHDFNPLVTDRVDNDEYKVSWNGADALVSSLRNIKSDYANQVNTAGIDEGTSEAADQMLEEIQAVLNSEGGTLRYPIEFYRIVRNNLLSRRVEVSDVYNVSVGDIAVPYVFFTNEADDLGVHHPFMVIASYGTGEGMNQLWDVPRPPGDGSGSYNEGTVTRNAHKSSIFAKIPMKDYGLVSSVTENVMEADLASDVGQNEKTHLTYSSLSGNGIALDGIIVYPAMNNTLNLAASVGEISSVGMHSGRGLDLHYHADSHSATGNGLNLYNDTDYIGRKHPPIITLSFDGIAGYGYYRSDNDSSDGASLALDEWGGHTHDAYRYHYHSEPAESTARSKGSSSDYTAHFLPPKGAWRGDINNIPEFWTSKGKASPAYKGAPGTFHGFNN